MASKNIYVYADWLGLNGPVINRNFARGINSWK
jgi:hypothetical protein